MSAPSRKEIFVEVVELREQLDAIQRAYEDGDFEAIGDILANDELDQDEDLEPDELDD